MSKINVLFPYQQTNATSKKIEKEINAELANDEEFQNGTWNLTCEAQEGGSFNWFNSPMSKLSPELIKKIDATVNGVFEKYKE